MGCCLVGCPWGMHLNYPLPVNAPCWMLPSPSCRVHTSLDAPQYAIHNA